VVVVAAAAAVAEGWGWRWGYTSCNTVALFVGKPVSVATTEHSF